MKRFHRLWLLAPAIAIAACAQPSGAGTTGAASRATAAPAPIAATSDTAANAPSAATLPRMLVHHTPGCGCCEVWIAHARGAGFTVDVREAEDIHAVKERLGVPYGKGSCHTVEVGGYFVEGHVPLEDVKRLLALRPQAKGLTVPGMPAGSPGMEMPDGRVQPYAVELVGLDGTTSVFTRHGEG